MKARLPQGYGGGGPQNMNAMIKQAQKMQEQMAAKQEELAAREFKATVGGGAVEVTMRGDKQLADISIKPEVVDPDDIEMLQDLVVAAVNEVYRMVDETTSEEMEQITGGINMPGMF
ncbi:YbaB/EbfC family nucleoid-associated protein [Ruminococcaceae bacterium OttesenSCG-928-L11]|nr:YbaB/EbfC family nucleoid-associated protein [Ruminococcaceae bacterium OttesenSCG-928-L11]